MTFNEWLEKVDAEIFAECGLTSADIEDYDYFGAFYHERGARSIARAAMRKAGIL